jgi:Ran GTPase-activating protein (RanGAP) involved in mRNA processing and transport
MRALSKLSLKDNALCTKEAGKALAAVLAGNSVLKELDLSNNSFYNSRDDRSDGPGFAQELAIGIRDNGAMTSLHVGMNHIPEKEMKEITTIAESMESMKMLCNVPFKNKTTTKLEVSGKNLGTEGALVVAEYLHDNREWGTIGVIFAR